MTVHGIDISYAQPKVNWEKVKNSNVEFVIVRAGYKSTIDTSFKSHISNAVKYAIDVGAYCYGMSKTVVEAKQEAKSIIAAIKPYKLTYPLFYDVEDNSLVGISKDKMTDICIAFLETVRAAGFYPALYTNPAWLEYSLDKSRLKKYDIWLAAWTNDANRPTRFNYGQTMWQWGTRKLEGISGEVDANICKIDYPAKIATILKIK